MAIAKTPPPAAAAEDCNCEYHAHTGSEARQFVLALVTDEMERTDQGFTDVPAATDDYIVDVIRHLNRQLRARNRLFEDD
jgi:hypothetical protein